MPVCGLQEIRHASESFARAWIGSKPQRVELARRAFDVRDQPTGVSRGEAVVPEAPAVVGDRDQGQVPRRVESGLDWKESL